MHVQGPASRAADVGRSEEAGDEAEGASDVNEADATLDGGIAELASASADEGDAPQLASAPAVASDEVAEL